MKNGYCKQKPFHKPVKGVVGIKELSKELERAARFLDGYLAGEEIRRAELTIIVGGHDESGGGQHIHISLLGKCTPCEECSDKPLP